MACIFSLVEMIFIDLRILAHIAFASAKASAKRGSFPDGNAPACRDTMKVPFPTGITPEFVAAQPVSKMVIRNMQVVFIFTPDAIA